LGAPQVRIRCQAGRVPHPARSGKLQRVIGLPA
jgi:hypothetical protein